MSTTLAALLATLITTGMSSAVSHQFTLVGGCVAAVMFTIAALVSRNVGIYPVFFGSALAMSVLALVSSEANTATLPSTIHVLSCYIALGALAVSSSDLSGFCQQLIMCNNLLLTGWILFQATRMNALEAWQISNPSGAGNLMAAQINMTLPLILTKIHESRGGIRILFLFVLAMNFVAVFLVMSRNGIGSMLIILTLYVLFKYKKIAFCVIGLILGCVVFLDSITRIPFIHNLLVKMRFVGFVPQAPRSVIWHISWDHILQNPLLGVGPGRPRKILAVLDIDHAHNNFMQVAFETGLPSAAVFASLMLLLIWLVVRMSFRNRESFVYTLSIVAYMVFSWTGGPLAFPGATLLLAACVNEARVAIKRQEKLKQALFLQRSSPVLPRTVRAA